MLANVTKAKEDGYLSRFIYYIKLGKMCLVGTLENYRRWKGKFRIIELNHHPWEKFHYIKDLLLETSSILEMFPGENFNFRQKIIAEKRKAIHKTNISCSRLLKFIKEVKRWINA